MWSCSRAVRFAFRAGIYNLIHIISCWCCSRFLCSCAGLSLTPSGARAEQRGNRRVAFFFVSHIAPCPHIIGRGARCGGMRPVLILLDGARHKQHTDPSPSRIFRSRRRKYTFSGFAVSFVFLQRFFTESCNV